MISNLVVNKYSPVASDPATHLAPLTLLGPFRHFCIDTRMQAALLSSD